MIAQLSLPHVKKFILEHQKDDPAVLLLAASKYPDIPVAAAAAQIKARQKAKHKIPSWHACNDVIFPTGIAMEQCSSEATAKLKSEWLGGDKLVDLTGGAGVDTYFLSRRFKHTCYVEEKKVLGQLAEYNFRQLHAPNIQVNISDAHFFLTEKAFTADWIYLDPARRDDHNARVFLLSDCQPDVTKMRDILFRHTDNILLKTSPMLDIKLALSELKNVKDIYVVAVKNDVKEVLYAINKGFSQNPGIHTINLTNSGNRESFSYDSHEASVAKSVFSYPKIYLYEPNAAVLKAGGFKLIGQYFNLSKLHPNSHLYTSDEKLKDFPGRKFTILSTTKLNKKEALAQIPGGRANITIRNFPLSAEMVRKKTGLKPGGDYYVFATTTMDDKLVLLICKKYPFDA